MKLVWDNQQLKVKINQLEVYIAPNNCAPFQVDAIAEEQDTGLVLEPTDIIHDYGDKNPLWYLANTQALQKTYKAGDIIIKSSSPVRILTIVHDLDYSPSWRSEWIAIALENIFIFVNEKKFSSLALPILGSQFGQFKHKDFISLLLSILEKKQGHYPEYIWLITKSEKCPMVYDLLKPYNNNV